MPPAPPRLVYAPAFEGLLEGIGPSRLAGPLRERLAALGVEPHKPLQAAYPLEVWLECLRVTARALYPTLPQPEALRQLAGDVLAGYSRTLAGRAVTGILRLLGPRGALKQLGRMVRSTDNYSHTETRSLGPRHMELRINLVSDTSPYVAGLLEQVARLAGAQAPHATLVREAEGHSTFQVTWEEGR